MYTADSERAQIAKARHTINESDPTGTQDPRMAFAQRVDQLKAELGRTIEKPEAVDFEKTARIAREAEEICRKVGDRRAADDLGRLAAGAAYLDLERQKGSFEPAPAPEGETRMEKIGRLEEPMARRVAETMEFIDPKILDKVPPGSKIAEAAEEHIENLEKRIKANEERAAMIAEGKPAHRVKPTDYAGEPMNPDDESAAKIAKGKSVPRIKPTDKKA
jgi:hypothetical protein